jgi:hypothetical protein
MKRETVVWLIILLAAGGYIVVRALTGGMGLAYEQRLDGVAFPADAWDVLAGSAQVSISRSIGVWVGALFTLFILSFVYKDSPFYKIAESVFVGVSAAYWMVVGFWTTIIPNLLGKLFPGWIQSWAVPGLSTEHEPWWFLYFFPLVLGVMLLWRLSPKGGWISRWPLAFFIGVFCGIRLIGFIHADFLSQIRNSIIPLVVLFEHKGVVGKTAKVGIWVLMITFGAGFGYTVMGRIALLAIRLEFLFDDWLWLIDPTDKRPGF